MTLLSRFEIDGDAIERDEESARAVPSRVNIVFLDTLRVRYSEAGASRALDLLLVLGIGPDGSKHPLGLWEGCASARLLQQVAASLRLKGVSGIQLAVFPPDMDGRLSFAQSFPEARIVNSPAHIFRDCLMQADPAQRIELGRRFRKLFCDDDARSALAALDRLTIADAESAAFAIDALRVAWPQLVEVFLLPPSLRKLVCGPSAVETLRKKLCRQCAKIPAEFASRQHAVPELMRPFRAVSAQWRVSVHEWRGISREFMQLRQERKPSVI